MPKFFKSQVHICLVGALVLSTGIYSLVQILSGLITGRSEFGLGFLLIFIGLGLLRGSSVQRGFFGALLALNLVVGAVVMIVLLVKGLFFDGGFEWPLFFWLGVAFLIIGYPYKILWNAKSDPWFAEKFSGKAPPFVIPVTVVLTLFYSVAAEVEEQSRRKAMADIFRFDLELRATDSETGEVIKNLGKSWGDRDFGELDVPDWMKGSRGGPNSFEGYSLGPFEFQVFAKGYNAECIKVNRDTKSVIEISLYPNPHADHDME